jgi:septum formation protein
LLNKLHIDAQCISPNIDETAKLDEPPVSLALRLAIEKAQWVAAQFRDAIVIGSDQVACLAGIQLGKPLSTDAAIRQLTAQSGQTVLFHTALCVICGPKVLKDVITTEVTFRTLTHSEIVRYVALENPIDCAGSFKCEGLGIALFDKITSEDPSALVGLPLIRTAQFLREFGVNPLG